MGRIPKKDEAPTYRRTTIRRRTPDEAEPTIEEAAPTEEAAAPAPAPAVQAPAAPAPAAPSPAAQAPRAAPAPAAQAPKATPAQAPQAPAAPAPKAAPAAPDRPSLDAAALLAELDAFDQDAMAALLASGSPIDLEPGDEVSGTVVRVTIDTVFVDIGAKSEAWLPLGELGEGQQVQLGEDLSAWVLSVGSQGVRLTRHLTSAGGLEALESAQEAGLPIDGRIESRNPGGFVVAIGSVRAFCPVSHVDRHPEPDLDAYLGRTLPFRVLEVRGRDVVVSHRVIADEEAERQAEALWKTVKPGDRLHGVVTGQKPYGVFVDVGGITGLVHKSELGWSQEEELPLPGTHVSVRVVEVDVQGGRLSLSLKDEAAGPWSRVGTEIVAGEVYPGKVVRLADFGAFIELLPGLQGLAHVSTLAEGRVAHPSDVLQVGQKVQVRVLSIDRERERLELGLRQAAEGWSEEEEPTRRGRGGPVHKDSGSLGTLADLLGGLKLKG